MIKESLGVIYIYITVQQLFSRARASSRRTGCERDRARFHFDLRTTEAEWTVRFEILFPGQDSSKRSRVETTSECGDGDGVARAVSRRQFGPSVNVGKPI